MTVITPDWPLPECVKAAITTRKGGNSIAPWESFNLGTRAGDSPSAVTLNREKLKAELGLATEPQWLQQVHGSQVVEAVDDASEREGDAVISRTPGLAAVVLTADCLPVLLCDKRGTVVAAVHAGWRGLASGIIRNTVKSMGVASEELLAYLGPAISKAFFEVGPEVQTAFIDQAINDSHAAAISPCFIPGKGDRLMADIYGLARAELMALGVSKISGGKFCTYRQKDQFYSYRRDQVTGRMASLIWIVD